MLQEHVIGHESAELQDQIVIMEEYARFLLIVRNGSAPTLTAHECQVLGLNSRVKDFIILPQNIIKNSYQNMLECAYPDFETHCRRHISEDRYFANNIVISPTHETTNSINMLLFDKYPIHDVENDDTSMAYSEDVLSDEDDPDIYSRDHLNTVVILNFANHCIPLRNGCVYMSLINLNSAASIQNETRFRLVSHNEYQLTGRILTGPKAGEMIQIPEHHQTCDFYRLQFPIIMAFAITIDKSQGQSIETMEFIFHALYFLMDNYIQLSVEPGIQERSMCGWMLFRAYKPIAIQEISYSKKYFSRYNAIPIPRIIPPVTKDPLHA